jgi:hypothetical protein
VTMRPTKDEGSKVSWRERESGEKIWKGKIYLLVMGDEVEVEDVNSFGGSSWASEACGVKRGGRGGEEAPTKKAGGRGYSKADWLSRSLAQLRWPSQGHLVQLSATSSTPF